MKKGDFRKNSGVIIVTLLCLLYFSASGYARSQTENTKEGRGQMHIEVIANSGTAIFILNNSSAASALYEQLPLQLDLQDYGDNEKIFYPSEKLDTSNTPMAKGGVGTLAYYAPWGDVVIFYKDFRPARGLYELGQLMSHPENLKEMSGLIKVKKQ